MVTGQLTVITGPMFAAKTAHLVERIHAAQAVGLGAYCFRPASDTRTRENKIKSRFGPHHQAILVEEPREILEKAVDPNDCVIAVDEAQLFTEGLYGVVEELLYHGYEVMVSGLERDFRGLVFPEFAKVIARADELIKLSARCHVCKSTALYTQRLRNGKPVEDAFEETIVIEGTTEYQARCGFCFVPPSNLRDYITAQL